MLNVDLNIALARQRGAAIAETGKGGCFHHRSEQSDSAGSAHLRSERLNRAGARASD